MREMNAVSSSARNGSPRLVVTLNRFRNGMTPSAAMACNNRGAPTRKYILTEVLIEDGREDVHDSE